MGTKLIGVFALSILFACSPGARRNEAIATSEESPILDPSSAIIVAGEAIPFDGPLRNFRDANGYDAHKLVCFFDETQALPQNPAEGCETLRRYSQRHTRGLAPATAERVATGGWDHEALKERVQHFVLHYDVCVTSRRCFQVLHDERGLSVHFLLDVDGTLYQTLDLAHRARHAAWLNDTSIGIEIAHIGGYPPNETSWRQYYGQDDGGLFVQAPPEFHLPKGQHRPSRAGLFRERINGREYVMVDYTEAQYRSLEKLVDWLARVFPRVKKKVPRTARGAVIQDEMTREELMSFEGILGHHQITQHKSDPGPAMDYDRLIQRARP